MGRSHLIACALAAFTTWAAPAAADAAVVLNATRVRVTSAVVPTQHLQIGEVQAFALGTGTNVALASQGGTVSASPDLWPALSDADAAWAIDGVLGDYPNIYTSASQGPDAYLEVIFAAPTTLSSLTIHGRQGCCSDRDVFNVQVFNGSGASLFTGVLDTNNEGHSATVTFDAPIAVPEPASWALMITGFAGLGGVLRRRRTFAPA